MADEVETEVQEETVAHVQPQRIIKKTRVITPVVSDESPRQAYQTKKAIFRTYQVVWYVLAIIEILLIFRFFFRMVGANAQSGFVSFIYALSDPFALPFQGIFPTMASEGSIIEWSTFVAMIVYALLAYGIVELLQLVKPTNPKEVEDSVTN